MRKIEIEEIKITDEDYPKRLKEIQNAPKKIYVLGNKKILNDKGIAIIGSRNCSEEGLKNARLFATNIANAGFTVISGMAKGIDSASHYGALEVEGKTIAVLGCGVDYIYPKENNKLYEEILDRRGVIISEYPPGTEPSSEKFRARNRIVSGLSLGVLVVEAKYRSGTSITIKYAKEQKRDVFCIPSSIENKKGIGTNIQIRKGATLVLEPREILERYDVKNIKQISIEELELKKETELEDIDERNKIEYIEEEIKGINETKDEKESRRTSSNLSQIKKEYREIYIAVEGGLSIDEISQKTKISLTEIYSKLFMMEIEGIIEKNGNSYIVKK